MKKYIGGGNHAFWKPIFGGGGVSFYENTDDLLKDINAEIIECLKEYL